MRRVVVFHRGYGCETGCCGHAVAVLPEGTNGEDYYEHQVPGSFEFDHADDDERAIEWARDFIRRNVDADHAADLDWDNCLVHTYDTCPM